MGIVGLLVQAANNETSAEAATTVTSGVRVMSVLLKDLNVMKRAE
jgi:hypothetical protein